MNKKVDLDKIELLWHYCFNKWYYNTAIIHYNEVVKYTDISNEKSMFMCFVGECLYKLWKNKQAYNKYLKAIKIGELDEKSYEKMAYFLNCIWNQKEALKYVNKWLEISCWYTDLMLTKWEILSELWEYKEAITFFNKSINWWNYHKNNYFWIAYAYDELKDHENAIKYYKLSIKQDKNYKQAYNNMWLNYKKLWNIKQAKNCFLKALEIDPKHETSRMELEKLNR
jgi:tetratricopeptide (TPR) repeat protein